MMPKLPPVKPGLLELWKEYQTSILYVSRVTYGGCWSMGIQVDEPAVEVVEHDEPSRASLITA